MIGSGEMALFHKTLRKHIFLHPTDKKRRYHAVKAALLQDKQKYSDRLQGALLDVNNLKIVGDRHLVVDGYLSMEVVADFYVFSPKLGQVLDGVINKCSKSHIGCLVMDTFNAALTLPPSCQLAPSIGDSCSFQVKEVVVDGEILFMRGTLKSVTPRPSAVSLDDEKVESGDIMEGYDDSSEQYVKPQVTEMPTDNMWEKSGVEEEPTCSSAVIKEEPLEVEIKEEILNTSTGSTRSQKRRKTDSSTLTPKKIKRE
ncbi:unnamed protein product [Lymnaea stagnalis]|uniref:RPA43 OB domain-containing protein n=1 Tax=Lymnaea stagnalis TaxID=6523 RepID=A0AAV2IJU2_LYMST